MFVESDENMYQQIKTVLKILQKSWGLVLLYNFNCVTSGSMVESHEQKTKQGLLPVGSSNKYCSYLAVYTKYYKCNQKRAKCTTKCSCSRMWMHIFSYFPDLP